MDNKITFKLEFIEIAKQATSLVELSQTLGVDIDTILAWANKKKKDENGNQTDELARPSFYAEVMNLSRDITENTNTDTQNTTVIQKNEEVIQEDKPKHAGGRPPKYTNPEELERVIEEYFDYCDNRTKKVWIEKTQTEAMISDPAPYTMSGLARALGLSRQGLIEYAAKDMFSDAIKEARERVHEDVETRLMEGKAQTGAIFNLKNNFSWKDQAEIDHKNNGKDFPTPIMQGSTSYVPTNNGDNKAS